MELDELHEGVSPSQSLSKDQSLEGSPERDGVPETQEPRESAAQQRRAAALRMGSLAMAGHHAAGDLEEHFPQTARYIHDAAAGFEHISNLLRDPSLDEVTTFIGNLGRRQPAAVAAGAILIVVGLSWFLKNSSNNPRSTAADAAADDRGRGTHGVH